jgi:hypothetical protein
VRLRQLPDKGVAIQGTWYQYFQTPITGSPLDLIRQSEKENAVAVGVDIDGADSVNFSLVGKPVYRKTIDEKP